MKTSQYLLATQKETPADAEIISHQLMLRAGMIRKLASGLYSWLPLGLRVLRKVETIIREELEKVGAIEILMPAVQPSELWKESGRWDTFNPPLLKLQDRHNREYCFGPTHEEVVTDLMRNELRSYKQLPLLVYQIQSKFRDELRPRSGVMRAREFLMNDTYSFHTDADCLQQTYDKLYGAYQKIFKRLGLDFRAVLADTGAIGGIASHEFHVLAKSGEDHLAYSDSSDYAANVELAQALPNTNARPAPTQPLQKVAVDVQSKQTIYSAAGLEPQQAINTVIVHGTENNFIALVLRADHALNEIKLEKLPELSQPLRLASPEEIAKHVVCDAEFIGPINLSIPMIVDHAAAQLADFACGANENGQLLTNVNWGRDLAEPRCEDLRKVVAGDPSPDGKGHLQIIRGIEVGHIFQLGDKYSSVMGAKVLNNAGKSTAVHMGCYGIGVSRIVAAAIEQNYDDKGILWPESISPFSIVLAPINMHKAHRVKEVAETLYEQLTDAGFDVLFDDRKERPGVIFANMDLIGIPHRLIISERGLDQGMVEYKHRSAEESQEMAYEDILPFFQKNK